jgi:hypothetical protein
LVQQGNRRHTRIASPLAGFITGEVIDINRSLEFD